MIFKLVTLMLLCNRHLIGGESRNFVGKATRSITASRTPSNIRMRTGEESIEIHWNPPSDTENLSFCTIEYKPRWGNTLPLITAPLAQNRHSYTISGLDSDLNYMLRLYCFYGNVRAPTTDWFYASTRTVSVEHNICPGTLPNAFLSLSCIDRPSLTVCRYTCADGYRKTGAPSKWMFHIDVKCENGSWTLSYAKDGFTLEDICLPEAEFQKCPLSIPNGRLEGYCGPGTDWLCEYQCNEGYGLYPYPGYPRFEPSRLLCENGEWKTGYEATGFDISGLCIVPGSDCPQNIPHGSVSPGSLSTGYWMPFRCDPGYRKKTLAVGDGLTCKNGAWLLKSTLSDPSITPETVCIHTDTHSNCPDRIPNGRIPDNCQVDCQPACNSGYRAMGSLNVFFPHHGMTCEDGKWIIPRYYNKPYTSDNVCFPNGGMYCSKSIPNGEIDEDGIFLRDDGTRVRKEMKFKCNPGFRKHRGVPFVECIAGNVVTWQERYGIDVSALCTPLNAD